MDEIAADEENPVDALCDLLISEGTFPYAIYFAMSDPDVRLAMQQRGSASVPTRGVNPDMKFIGKPIPLLRNVHAFSATTFASRKCLPCPMPSAK